MKKPTPAERTNAFNKLVAEIQRIEFEAMQSGFYITGRALNQAKNTIGWEFTGNINEASKARVGKGAENNDTSPYTPLRPHRRIHYRRLHNRDGRAMSDRALLEEAQKALEKVCLLSEHLETAAASCPKCVANSALTCISAALAEQEAAPATEADIAMVLGIDPLPDIIGNFTIGVISGEECRVALTNEIIRLRDALSRIEAEQGKVAAALDTMAATAKWEVAVPPRPPQPMET